MPKWKLLILDAGVVISLHELGCWSAVVDRCDIHLSATVVDEANYYKDGSGDQVPIDLQPDVATGRVTVFDIALKQVEEFRKLIAPLIMHPGETESLAHLHYSDATYTICAGDHAVYKVLGKLNRGDQGRSLQEVLDAIGLTKKVHWKDTKKFREQKTEEGRHEFAATFTLPK